MKELVGKIITGIYVNGDQNYLKFETNEGDLHYCAEGDCCSESWFADILLGYNFLNQSLPITEVIELDVPDWASSLIEKDGRTRQEHDQVYGFSLVRGRNDSAEIVFRNSSNGYYGGWCEYVGSGDMNLPEQVWTQITEDWRA